MSTWRLRIGFITSPLFYTGGVYMWEYLMQSSRCVIGWALEIYQPYICLVEGCSVGCTVVDGLHVPGREHVLSHRSWNRGSQQRSFLAGCPQCSAVQCIADVGEIWEI